MGTIITFIALIFTATIAAGVVIQTSQGLQSKALQVGSRASQNVADFLLVKTVTGEDGTGENLTRFYVRLNVIPSSGGMNFNDLSVKMQGADDTIDLSYNSIVANCDPSAAPADKYDVEYVLNNSAKSRSGYLMPGDVAEICFTGYNVSEGESARLIFTTATGKQIRMDFTAPQSFTDKFIDLYP